MKFVSKPLGIAVVAAAVSYAGGVAAQSPVVANNALGDLAIVPYYTVEGNWTTGVHEGNTSDRTQVIKFRLRRAEDSLDALDFNVVLSPWDVWAGLINDDGPNGEITFKVFGDTSCTVPIVDDGTFVMPSIYAEGAETGYLEVIGMGTPTTEAGEGGDASSPRAETSLVAVAAKHGADGLPDDCEAVASNFFRNGDAQGGFTATAAGNINYSRTHHQAAGASSPTPQYWADTGNVLKVSYFIRDTSTGVEFGDNAVHIKDFLTVPAMSNQQGGGMRAGDLAGFDFPDLNGGLPAADSQAAGGRGRFNLLRAPTVLGVTGIQNEWSSSAENAAIVNWVVTFPGQYTMLDLPDYISTIEGVPGFTCPGGGTVDSCDNRDIPVRAQPAIYNRDEAQVTDPGDLVVSPAVPGEATLLEKEVNLVDTGGGIFIGGADNEADNTFTFIGEESGWVNLAVTSSAEKAQAVCEWDLTETGTSLEDLDQDCVAATGNVPMIGFAAWQRSVAENPDRAYGKIIAHSFTSGS